MSNRYLSEEDVRSDQLVHAVWELTLACNLKCLHCGSRAGERRPDELSTAECLDVVRQLAELGAREVTLIGGEAYLRPDWVDIVRAISNAGMRCTLQTGAWRFTEERVQRAADAGLAAAGVSIDGLAPLHDHLRGAKGSFDNALDALRRLRAHGIRTSVNTQITAAVIPQLRDLLAQLLAVGVVNWQVQLTVAMGRAVDNHQLLIQPYQLLELMPLLAELYAEGVSRGLLLQPGNNIGFFGPYESTLRGSGNEEIHWTGCSAGRSGIGIEADGTIKGCPSLPTAGYAGGNIRDWSLVELWKRAPQLAFTRRHRGADLWGFCGSCYYADVCQGGCTWTSHSLLGKPGNNPYCHHRALEMDRQGLRERVIRRLPAPGRSFDHGAFDIAVERVRHEGDDPIRPVPPPPPRLRVRQTNARTLPFLVLCRGCHRHVFPGTELCPHCGGYVPALERAYTRCQTEADAAAGRVLRALDRAFGG